MPKLRVHNFTLSLDGYGAGPDQGIDEPLGVRGRELHEWAFATRHFREMMRMGGGDEGVDNRFAVAGDEGIGATVMGRNMFGPVRGEWGGSDWTGWWGDEPPYHCPVFVLTHHPRDAITMEGGTTFHFVTGGPEEALRRAVQVAGDRHVSIAGGASTINQFLRAGHIDELRLHVAPILLGSGEALFTDLDGLSFEVTSSRSTSLVAHVTLRRTSR
jgi:dihydrofolate reductase